MKLDIQYTFILLQRYEEPQKRHEGPHAAREPRVADP